MKDDDFELWLGRIAKDRLFAHQVRAALALASYSTRSAGDRTSWFNGSRISRGSATGRILGAANRHSDRLSRRVIVKSRIVRLTDNGANAAAVHLRYLQRDGTTREGNRGTLYSANSDSVDGKAFLERGSGDRHQFRIIVAAEDGAEYDDLKKLIRRLLLQAERDLGTKLDWVAVDHFNTGHPHSHVLVRGKDDRGADLIIAREYITKGLRQRAVDLVNLDLGPRTELEIMRANLREVGQERFTGIDQRLLWSVGADGLVSPHNLDGIEQSLRAGRLATLGRMGLAVEERKGRWRLSKALEPTLRAMGKHGDIIATLDREVRARGLAAAPADYSIFDPTRADVMPVIGLVVARGLSDEQVGREYLVVDGIDGRAHYVEIGVGREQVSDDTIVQIVPASVSIRDVDRTIAHIAAANAGRYSEDIHLRHDPTAGARFIQTHIRRLEAIRRSTGGVRREVCGSWTISTDHFERVLEYECRRAAREPVLIEPLATMALDLMPAHDGITWLDEEPSFIRTNGPIGSFARRVADAMQKRRQWLVEQGLLGNPDRLAILRRRELQRITGQLSNELGSNFVEADSGLFIEGTYLRSVQVGVVRMAIIENKHKDEFTLAPWRPVLDRQIGQQVSGIVRGSGISWSVGRQRSGPAI